MTFDEDEYYEVKRISGQKYFRQELCYLIEWAGYAPEDSTWEIGAGLNKELVEDFQNQLKKEFPDRPNILLAHERILLPGAYDPEKPVAKSREPPLALTINSITSNKRPALDSPKTNSPKKASRKSASPEKALCIPEKLKRKWKTVVRDLEEKDINEFLRTLNLSVINAKAHTCTLVQTSKTHSYFEGLSTPVEVINTVDDEIFPKDFVYINSLVYGKNVPQPDPSFLAQCECGTSNCTSPCHDNHSLVYSNNGQIKVSPGIPIYECNEKCECNIDCPNRVVQRGRQIPLQIYKTKQKGWGVKAKQRIQKGMFVEEYLGEVINNDTGDLRGKFYDIAGTTYLFDMDFSGSAKYVIDSFLLGNASHFFNHSCSPNLTVYAIYSDSADPDFHRLAFFSNCDIKKGQELTVDYEGPNSNNASIRTLKDKITRGFKCHCESKQCRKYIHENSC